MQSLEGGLMLSLVVPVFRNEDSLPDLIGVLGALSEAMGGDFEAVLVVDGSPDRSLEVLSERLPSAPFPSQLIALSRNFGSFSAIRAGLAHARGEIMAVMAADLQEPPDLVLGFREKLQSGDYDVAVGRRDGRGDPWSVRLGSSLFWSCYRRLVQREVPDGGVDVFACTREFRDHLLALGERNSTLVGLVFWLGFRRAEVSYTRAVRKHGKSAWTFGRRLRYLLDSTFAFSDLPMKLLTLAGALGVGVSIILALVVLVTRLRGGIPIPGYAATVLIVMFFGGLNSLGLGMVGEYIWRTFENTKGRPDHVVACRHNFPGARREQ
jgi:polyisoprenyl-phosphate glycosyltransferase